MVSKRQLLQALPPFQNKNEIIVPGDQSTSDIKREIMQAHKAFASDYDQIYSYFDTGEPYSTGKGLWEFLRHDFTYDAESGDDQTSKPPAAILQPGEKVDCKHYSLFAGGILDAINRNEGENWDWCYRFASEDSNIYPSHVFIVMKIKGREVWLDPCLFNYDSTKAYRYISDKKPKMAIRRISGTKELVEADSFTINQVDPVLARTNFLDALSKNDLQIADLMRQNPQVTMQQFAPWWQSIGGNWNDILNALA